MDNLNLRGLSVLIECSNQNMALLLRSALKALGIGRVIVESDTQTAMQIMASSVVDLIFYDLDTGEPEKKALEFVRMVRSEKDSPIRLCRLFLCRPIPRLRPSTRPAMPGSMNPWPSRIGKIIYRYIVAVVTKRRDFVRAANYFGPNRHRHSDEDYEGKERRKTDADLGEAEASKFEKEGGQRETLKFLD